MSFPFSNEENIAFLENENEDINYILPKFTLLEFSKEQIEELYEDLDDNKKQEYEWNPNDNITDKFIRLYEDYYDRSIEAMYGPIYEYDWFDYYSWDSLITAL